MFGQCHRTYGHRRVGVTPETLIGSSETMRSVQKTIGMLADSNATVLISGETGTGRSWCARDP